MYFHCVTLLIVITCSLTLHASQIEKCCGLRETLGTNVDGAFQCLDNARLQIQAKSSNIMHNNTDGFCVDGKEDHFSNFVIIDGKISSEEKLEIKPFAKCCPLKYYYNSGKHACLPKENLNSFNNESFIKVGLPTCRIIIDHHFDSMEQLNHKLIETENRPSCVDLNEKNGFVLRVCESAMDICDSIKCIKKCCPDGQSFVNGSNCGDTFEHGIDMRFSARISKPDDPFAIIHRYTCQNIFLLSEQRYQFQLNDKGILKRYYNSTKKYKNFDIHQENSYCIEHSNKLKGYGFFMCIENPEEKPKFVYSKWAKLVSCIFLAITILVYLVLNKTANLFGKLLISYCVAMLLTFTLFSYMQFAGDIADTLCLFIGYILIYALFCGFTWLNIISWDIWSTFGSPKVLNFQKKMDLKKMIFYSLYGWGFPLLMTVLTFTFSFTDCLPSAIHPVIGKTKCFIGKENGNYASMLFKDAPLLILQIINTVLFIKTIVYCMKVKSEINRMNDTASRDRRNKFNTDKERLALIGKLSVIMGLSYTFEVISSFFDMNSNDITRQIEVVWDLINCFQGVFIFVIFICKKQICLEFRKKLGSRNGRKLSIGSNTHLTDVTNTSLITSGKINRP